MATVKSGVILNSNFADLKEISTDEIRKEIFDLLIENERVIAQYKTIRDQVVFTTKRIFVVNVQGITGKKVSYYSYPYSKVQYFGIQTAGLLDIDSELELAFSDGNVLSFDFKSRVDIRKLSTIIAQYTL